MPWYIFALLTPTFYSITFIVDKFLLEKRIPDPFALTAVYGLTSGLVGIILGILTGFQSLEEFHMVLILCSGMLLVLYLVPYFEALKHEDVSRVAPLFQFIPVFTVLFSSIFLNESPTVKQIFGLLMVVIAGVLLTLKKVEGSIFRPRKSLWFILLSSFMYGFVSIIFRYVSRDANFWSVLSYEYIGTGIGAALFFLFPRVRHGLRADFSKMQKSLGIITVNHTLTIGAQMSEAYAVTLVAVPFVSILGGVEPLLVLLFGIVLTLWFPQVIKEDIKKAVVTHKLLSVLLMFCGLFLVYF